MYFKIDGQSICSGWGAVSCFEGVVTVMSRHFEQGSHGCDEVKSAFDLTPAEARIFALAILEIANQAEAFNNGD